MAYDTNFFESFGEEVIKYSSLGETLIELFDGKLDMRKTLDRAEEYARKNSAREIARRFLELFQSLPVQRKTKAAA